MHSTFDVPTSLSKKTEVSAAAAKVIDGGEAKRLKGENLLSVTTTTEMDGLRYVCL